MNIPEALVASIAILCATFVVMLLIASRNERKIQRFPWIKTAERFPDAELTEHQNKYGDNMDMQVISVIEGAKEATALYWNGDHFYDDAGTPYPVNKWMPFPKVTNEN